VTFNRGARLITGTVVTDTIQAGASTLKNRE
jgi:hypothetical protein